MWGCLLICLNAAIVDCAGNAEFRFPLELEDTDLEEEEEEDEEEDEVDEEDDSKEEEDEPEAEEAHGANEDREVGTTVDPSPHGIDLPEVSDWFTESRSISLMGPSLLLI